MIQAASPIFTGDMWLQQKFCRLQKLSTHKDNNSYNYNCVQSNKDKGTVYQTGMPSTCFALWVNE